LLNALAQGNHAIVSPTAGTTRDWVSVTIQHPTLSFELIDTAGYEPTGDALFEAEIGARREDALRLADVVVWCEEIGRSSSPPEHLACDVRVGTKSDLGRDEACGMSEIEVSSRTGAGLDALVERLVGILVTKEGRKGESSLSARVAGSLREARTALDQARQTHGSAVGHEFVAMLVREALDPLGEIGGAVFTDDLLDRIFSKFCIGK
jgi:tRNA modification GTPase